LLLVALGVTAAFAMLGNTELTQNPPVNQQASSSGEQSTPSAGGGSTSGEQTAQGGSAGDQESSDARADAAQAVEDFYASAAAHDYEKASNLLTASQRQSVFPSPDAFKGQFDTLKQISFVTGPDAQVSDGTATVTGETIAEHSNRTERNRGTWTLVNENGGWKISGWNVSNISTRYV
jgi:hypothetical protein